MVVPWPEFSDESAKVTVDILFACGVEALKKKKSCLPQ